MQIDTAPMSGPSSASPTAGKTILVADDDPDLLALMARRLVKGGYVVVTAVDGQQAFEMATRLLPDLALMDVMMPKLTGLEVAARLRADPSTNAVKIILISAGFEAGVGESMSKRSDGYIAKPFGRDEPVDRVRTVLEG
jgi:CheY-like chemotaxis protein